MNQTQNVAMISGASRGIGLAIARALLGRGCRLSLGVREPRSVPADLVRSDDVLVCRYEARDRHAGRAFVDETVAWSGRLDVLVNNALTSKRSSSAASVPSSRPTKGAMPARSTRWWP